MLREEFSYGLKATRKYEESLIDEVVPKIVNVTHDVRHKGLIQRIRWENIVVEKGGTSTNVGYMQEVDEIIFTDDLLQDLLVYAQEGCAFGILKRIEERRSNWPSVP